MGLWDNIKQAGKKVWDAITGKDKGKDSSSSSKSTTSKSNTSTSKSNSKSYISWAPNDTSSWTRGNTSSSRSNKNTSSRNTYSYSSSTKGSKSFYDDFRATTGRLPQQRYTQPANTIAGQVERASAVSGRDNDKSYTSRVGNNRFSDNRFMMGPQASKFELNEAYQNYKQRDNRIASYRYAINRFTGETPNDPAHSSGFVDPKDIKYSDLSDPKKKDVALYVGLGQEYDTKISRIKYIKDVAGYSKVRYGKVADNEVIQYSDYMTGDELARYYYALGKGGYASANKYFESIEQDVVDRYHLEKYSKKGENVVKDKGTLGSVVPRVGYSAKTIGQSILTNTFNADYDINHPLYNSNAIVRYNMDAQIENEMHDNAAIKKFATRALHGLADSVPEMGLRAVPKVGVALAATAGFAENYADKYAQYAMNGTLGAEGTKQSAMLFGALGAVEYGFLGTGTGKITGKVFSNVGESAFKKAGVKVLDNALLGAGIGATQYTIDQVGEQVFLGENSTFELTKKSYMESGLSEDEAADKALTDSVKFGVEAMAVGAITSVGMGAGSTLGDTVSLIPRGKMVKASEGYNDADFLAAADGFARDSEAYKNAQLLKKRNRPLRNDEVGALALLYDVEISRQKSYTETMSDVTGLKFEGGADKIADSEYMGDGVVRVSDNAESDRVQLINHETAHAVEQAVPEAYNVYADGLRSKAGYTEAVDKVKATYDSLGLKYNDDILHSEVAADFSSRFFRSSSDVQRLSRTISGNAKFFDHIYNRVNNLAIRLKGLGGRDFVDSTTGIRVKYSELVDMRNRYADALLQAKDVGYNNGSHMFKLKADLDTKIYGLSISESLDNYVANRPTTRSYNSTGRNEVTDLIRDAYKDYNSKFNDSGDRKLAQAAEVLGRSIHRSGKEDVAANFASHFRSLYFDTQLRRAMLGMDQHSVSEKQEMGFSVQELSYGLEHQYGINSRTFGETHEFLVRDLRNLFQKLKTSKIDQSEVESSNIFRWGIVAAERIIDNATTVDADGNVVARFDGTTRDAAVNELANNFVSMYYNSLPCKTESAADVVQSDVSKYGVAIENNIRGIEVSGLTEGDVLAYSSMARSMIDDLVAGKTSGYDAPGIINNVIDDHIRGRGYSVEDRTHLYGSIENLIMATASDKIMQEATALKYKMDQEIIAGRDSGDYYDSLIADTNACAVRLAEIKGVYEHDTQRQTRLSKTASNTYMNRAFAESHDFILQHLADFTYKSENNPGQVKSAQAKLEQQGQMKCLSDLLAKEAWGGSDTAMAFLLMTRLQQQGDSDGFFTVAKALQKQNTRSGQQVQANMIAKKLTAEGIVVEYKASHDRYVHSQIEAIFKGTYEHDKAGLDSEVSKVESKLEEAKAKDAQEYSEASETLKRNNVEYRDNSETLDEVSGEIRDVTNEIDSHGRKSQEDPAVRQAEQVKERAAKRKERQAQREQDEVARNEERAKIREAQDNFSRRVAQAEENAQRRDTAARMSHDDYMDSLYNNIDWNARADYEYSQLPPPYGTMGTEVDAVAASIDTTISNVDKPFSVRYTELVPDTWGKARGLFMFDSFKFDNPNNFDARLIAVSQLEVIRHLLPKIATFISQKQVPSDFLDKVYASYEYREAYLNSKDTLFASDIMRLKLYDNEIGLDWSNLDGIPWAMQGDASGKLYYSSSSIHKLDYDFINDVGNVKASEAVITSKPVETPSQYSTPKLTPLEIAEARVRDELAIKELMEVNSHFSHYPEDVTVDDIYNMALSEHADYLMYNNRFESFQDYVTHKAKWLEAEEAYLNDLDAGKIQDSLTLEEYINTHSEYEAARLPISEAEYNQRIPAGDEIESQIAAAFPSDQAGSYVPIFVREANGRIESYKKAYAPDRLTPEQEDAFGSRSITEIIRSKNKGKGLFETDFRKRLNEIREDFLAGFKNDGSEEDAALLSDYRRQLITLSNDIRFKNDMAVRGYLHNYDGEGGYIPLTEGRSTFNALVQLGVSKKGVKSHYDTVLDSLGVKHLSSVDLDQFAEMIRIIHNCDDVETLIDNIINLSHARKTSKTDFALEAALRRYSKDFDIDAMRSLATSQVFGFLNDKLNKGIGRKANTMRYVSQLLNGCTMFGNIVSEIVNMENTTKHVAYWLDKPVAALTGKKTIGTNFTLDPTKNFKRYSENIQSGIKRANQAYLETALDVNILNREGGTDIYGYRAGHRTFKGGIFGALERGLGYGLTVSDEFLKGIYYNDTVNEMKGLNCFSDSEIHKIANDDALYRTFQNETFLSTFLDGAKEFGNKWSYQGMGLGDLVLPYTRVTGNVVTRSWEYTPLGYLHAIYQIGKLVNDTVKTGRAKNKIDGVTDFRTKMGNYKNSVSSMQQRKALLALARPITGTGFIFACYGLAKAGILVGVPKSNDYEKEEYEKSKKLNDYKINLSALQRLLDGDDSSAQYNDLLVDFGYIVPFNSLASIGGSLYNKTDGFISSLSGKELAFLMGRESLNDAFTQFTDLNMWSTVNGAVKNYKNADGELSSWFALEAADMLMQWFPSIVRQYGNATDDYERYPYRENDLLDLFKHKVKAQIPFVREGEPMKIDAWGQAVSRSTGNDTFDFFNQMLLRNSFSRYNSNDLTGELDRLGKMSTDIFPKSPYKSYDFELNGQHYHFDLEGHDYEAYKNMLGSMTYKSMYGFITSKDYKYLSDQQKIDILSDIASKTSYKVRDLWAGQQLGASDEELVQQADEFIRGYKNKAGDIVKQKQATDYLEGGGVKVESVIDVGYYVPYTPKEAAEQIATYQSYIDKIYGGTFGDSSVSDKRYKYSRNWPKEKIDNKVASYQKLIDNIKDGSRQKYIEVTGDYTSLSDEDKDRVKEAIEKHPEKLRLPAEVLANKPEPGSAGHTVIDLTDKRSGDNYSSLVDLGFKPKFLEDSIKANQIESESPKTETPTSASGSSSSYGGGYYRRSYGKRYYKRRYYKRRYYKRSYRKRYYSKRSGGKRNNLRRIYNNYNSNSSGRFGDRFGFGNVGFGEGGRFGDRFSFTQPNTNQYKKRSYNNVYQRRY